MDHVRPDSQLTSVIISASEDNGNITTLWALSGFATCAPALPGLERIVATDTTQDALGGFSATARCSFGRKLLGVAGDINFATGRGSLDELTALDPLGVEPLTSATTTAYPSEGPLTAPGMAVTAYAICAQK
jgi:hypothetical protein